MSGKSGGSRPALPPAPAPEARLEAPLEVDEAKRKVKRRDTGRQSQIFAGQLNSARNNELNQILG